MKTVTLRSDFSILAVSSQACDVLGRFVGDVDIISMIDCLWSRFTGTYPPEDGLLECCIIQCESLLSADSNGMSDPYVKVQLGGKQLRPHAMLVIFRLPF